MLQKRLGSICLSAALCVLPALAQDTPAEPWEFIMTSDDGGHHGSGGGHGGGESGDDHGGNNPGTAPSQANPSNNDTQRTRVSFAVTPQGVAIRAEGHVDLRARGSDQKLTVEVQANVPDGTTFEVVANGIPIGSVTLRLGHAEFEFETENGRALPGGLVPAGITSVLIRNSVSGMVLSAQFGALGTPSPQPTAPLTSKRVTLTATAAGRALDASGHVDLRALGSSARLSVEAEARVADGTMWKVFANGISIGTIRFRLQEGELQLETESSPLPAGLTSLASIGSIQVFDAANNLVLSASL